VVQNVLDGPWDLPDDADGVHRAVSPVVGVALLASVLAGSLVALDDSLESPGYGDGPDDDESGGDEQDADDPVQNPWSGNPLLGPEDPTAGATDVRYRVYFEIADQNMVGDSLNEVRISVTTGDDMFSGTDATDLETFTVETTDGTEKEISDDVNSWQTGNDGSELVIGLQGNGHVDPSIGDVIVIVFGGVDNPEAPGIYDVTAELNGGEDGQAGELEIVEE
jgi:hypothetical protein